MLNCSPQDLIKKIVDAGFSQTFVSKETGISQPTISRIFSGVHKDPKSSVIERLKLFAHSHIQ